MGPRARAPGRRLRKVQKGQTGQCDPGVGRVQTGASLGEGRKVPAIAHKQYFLKERCLDVYGYRFILMGKAPELSSFNYIPERTRVKNLNT